jgi:DNA repair protein RadC
MSIRSWPLGERPREKLLAHGATMLSDAELLAIFIGSGGRGEDAVARGRSLLASFGSLRGLLSQPARDLVRAPGLGEASVCRLLAALEIGRRHLHEAAARGGLVSDPDSAGALFHSRLRDRPHEVFACAFLDTRHRLIAYEELFRGGIDGAEVHPREVVRRSLAHNAAAVLFGHNHPSGVAEPSAADRAITRRLSDALALIDVRVLDHFVVGDGRPVSLAARGWL